jgi:hypothetical protein
MARPRSTLIALVALAALAAGACSNGPVTAPPGAVSGSPTPQLLDFEAPLLDGGTFHGEDLAGKDVAFWFWAPW